MCEFCKIEDHEEGYMFGELLDEHMIDMGAFIASIKIPIKYCPICGRELN